MSIQPRLRRRTIRNVGTVTESSRGGWNWQHLDGTNTTTGRIPVGALWLDRTPFTWGPVDYFEERFAVSSLLAWHFAKGIMGGKPAGEQVAS